MTDINPEALIKLKNSNWVVHLVDLYCLSYLNWLAVQSSATMGGPILSILFQQREKRKKTNNGRNGTEGRIGSMGVHVHISLHVCHKTTKRLVIRFYPGRIFLIYFNLIPFQNVNANGLRNCMLLDQNQNNQLHGWMDSTWWILEEFLGHLILLTGKVDIC
jgi:hypothetical protein